MEEGGAPDNSTLMKKLLETDEIWRKENHFVGMAPCLSVLMQVALNGLSGL